MDLNDITLAVLAGGEGTRMGQPKGFLEVHGQPVLEYLLEAIAWPGPTLLVTAPGRDNPPGCHRFDREVADAVAGEGPLRGVLTALEAAHTATVMVITVDMPCVRQEHLEWVAQSLGEFLAVMLKRDAGLEPFPSAWSIQAAPLIRQQLTTGRRSLHSLTTHPKIQIHPAPDTWPDTVWTNLNHPEDLRMYLQTNPKDTP